MLFPISLVPFEVFRDWELFDSDLGSDSAGEVRKYYVPNFGNWKDHDAFTHEFGKLIKALQSTDDTPTEGR